MCENFELIEEIDVNSALKELDEALTMLSPEDRAYMVVKSFFQTEELSDEIHAMFFEWMLNPDNKKAKQYAMERVFKECLDSTMCLEGLKK